MLVEKAWQEQETVVFVAFACVKAHEQMADSLGWRRRQQRRRTPPSNRRCLVLIQIGHIRRGAQSRTNMTNMKE